MDNYFSLQYLNNLFRVRSTDGKNSSFSAALSNNNSPFYVNTSMPEHEELPYVYAGGQITYAVSTSFGCTSLPCFTLIYIMEGSAKFFCDDVSYHLQENTLLLFSPQSGFSFQTTGVPFGMKMFFVDGKELYSYLHILNSGESNPFYLQKECSSLCMVSLEQMQQLLKNPRMHSDLFLSKCLRDIFCDITYAYDIPAWSDFPNHVIKCKAILEEEYAQPITLDMLQERIGVNKYHLCHDFSEYMHISPMKYLLQIRIDKSKELLVQTDLTIHAVGNCVGIPNTTHFINQFRKICNITPLQYRNSITTIH